MKTRILGAVMGIAALSGLLVASPAQARDGVSSVRIDPSGGYGGGYVRTTVDFTSRTRVVFRNFTVRDICPGDNVPVRARLHWIHTDRTDGRSAWMSDTNGCGDDGTNFGTSIRTGTKSISKIRLELCSTYCDVSAYRFNQYAHPGY
ncbi:hypothetical protein [Nonomuraea fuscirosea]|uniref:hypothetical protein n=1 Tax=Nonomuraea fuscirosea TaxID=1291556 RepID=UPI00343CDC5C